MDELRIGDAEREAAVAALGEHYALGRLDKTEFDERTDAAWSARTRGDLRVLFTDLEPVRPAPGRRAPSRRAQHLRGSVCALIAVLVVLTVVTHLPLILFALVVWCVLRSRRGGWAHTRGRSRRSPGRRERSWA